jgi:aspartyl-tRNA(Asn)/glutamyl-tRNA(Gln) amidotransferase subunit A
MLCPELDQIGPLARTVPDAALMTQVMAGKPFDQLSAAPRGFQAALLTNFDAVELEADVADGYEKALAVVAAMAGPMRALTLPDYEPTLARRAGLLIAEADGWQIHAASMGRAPEAYSTDFTSMLAYGCDADPAHVERARQKVHDLGRQFATLLREVDVVLAPTAPQAAFPFNASVPVSQADLTAIASFAGAPAVSLPMSLTRTGMPTGLQLIAAPGRDDRLLAIAAAVEAALPWRRSYRKVNLAFRFSRKALRPSR